MPQDIPSLAERMTEVSCSIVEKGKEYFANHVYFQDLFHDDDHWRNNPERLLLIKDDAGKKLEGELIQLFADLGELAEAAGCEERIRGYLDAEWLVRERCPWPGPFKNNDSEVARLMSGLQAALLDLPDKSPGEILVIADTNTLIRQPKLEDWRFDGINRFTIVLPSAVLSELDSFETSNKNEEVRKTSAKLVRQIKGYRDRAKAAGNSILDGVPIVRDKISLRLDPIEPDFNGTLSFLNPAANDHKILARTIGLQREHPRCGVVLVTRDINLQNKADVAHVITLEPPGPDPN